MTSSTTSRVRRAALQDLRTIELLGLDFIPVLAADEHAESGGHGVEIPDGKGGMATAGISQVDIAALKTTEQKQHALDQLRATHDAECPHCTTATAHTQTVFGEGSADADLMFIGEAPGRDEDRTGRPFVGRAGKKLDEIIGAMQLSRDDVYIANVLKSRPAENRTPLPGEVAKCGPYLARQVQIIQPKVIVTLGGPAAKLILDTTVGITRLRGTWGSYTAGSLAVPVMPTFHPAYLLRNYTKDTRAKVWSDMQQVMERLGLQRK